MAKKTETIKILSRNKFTKTTKGLDESDVFSELVLRHNLKSMLPKNVYSILAYTFTEMLNNAIDHSRSTSVDIEFEVRDKDLKVSIRDFGVGIFRNVAKKFKLQNSFEALNQILKGRQTTDPVKHSGQGIFFASKAVDIFQIQSDNLTVCLDNIKDDIKTEKSRLIKGTLISFSIRKRTRRKLKEIFDSFTDPESLDFDRTKILVKLSGNDAENLSRSQARKILLGLEVFKVIQLDFKKVTSIGQAFADEIFRVYLNAHPSTHFEILNANSDVLFMIKRTGFKI